VSYQNPSESHHQRSTRQKVRIRSGHRPAAQQLRYENQAVRLGKGERPQQHRIDDAEDGGVGANTQGECEDGD